MEPYNLQFIVNVEVGRMADKEVTEFQGSEWNKNAPKLFNSYKMIKDILGLKKGNHCLLEGYFHVTKEDRLLKGSRQGLKNMGKVEINLAYCQNYNRILNFYRCYSRGFQSGKKSNVVAYPLGKSTSPFIISTDNKKIYVIN